jgi:tryptophan 7-halogenase
MPSVNKIVVLGGGSAGWLTALFLNKMYNLQDITVIEDPNTLPIVAGESGSSVFNNLLLRLGINPIEWIDSVDALPKLGGKMSNWTGDGDVFFHGLISSGYADTFLQQSLLSESSSNLEFLSQAIANNTPFENIFFPNALMLERKIPFKILPDNKGIRSITAPMYHFNSRKNADYLKNIGIERGIKLVQGKYIRSTKNDNGDLVNLILEDRRVLSSDWYFDCSGFARLLLSKECGVKYDDYSNFFPANSVVAWWDDVEQFNPYTELTALKCGWSWNISISNRVGSGYLYDNTCITEDQALEEAEKYYNKKINPIAKLKFTPSGAKETWFNNVIGIGLSTGFLEPLESNGISQIYAQLSLLEKYWNPDYNDKIARKLYNDEQYQCFYRILLFLSLHYRGGRTDSKFWQSHTFDKFRIPDQLQDILDLWKEGIVINHNETDRMFSLESWLVVASGLKLIDRSKLRNHLSYKNKDRFRMFLENQENIEPIIKKIVTDCCTIDEWIRYYSSGNQTIKYCKF